MPRGIHYGSAMALQETDAVQLFQCLATLKAATTERRRVLVGTPAYEARLAEEMRLVREVRRLIDEDRRAQVA